MYNGFGPTTPSLHNTYSHPSKDAYEPSKTGYKNRNVDTAIQGSGATSRFYFRTRSRALSCAVLRPMLAVNADGAVELHFSLLFCATLAAALARTLQSNARQRAVDVDFCGLLKVSWA